jgi:hypothetical protein
VSLAGVFKMVWEKTGVIHGQGSSRWCGQAGVFARVEDDDVCALQVSISYVFSASPFDKLGITEQDKV